MTSRETYRVFPVWSNGFWTWLTGAPLDGEQPRMTYGPWSFLILALLSYAGGITLAICGASNSGNWAWVCVALGWCFALSGSRRMVSTVVHQCIHGRFSGRRKRDQIIGELLTVLTFTQTAEAYRQEHFEQHHRYGVFSGKDDPAVQFLMRIGFKQGLSVPMLWVRLLFNVVSPQFHLYFLTQRVRSNFVDAKPIRMGAAYMHLLVWCVVVAMGWIGLTSFVLGVIVPIVLLYQVSVMLEFISEHAWLVPVPSVAHARDVHLSHSWARFCGSPTPSLKNAGSTIICAGQWFLWFVTHVIYHLPVRLLVLPGDLPQHDFHHRSPNTTEWPMAAYGRQRYLRDAAPRTQELTPQHRAIHHVFTGLAAQAPDDTYSCGIPRNNFGETEV